MAHLITRSNSQAAAGNALRDVLGWDPLRNFFPVAQQVYGLDITRNENGFTVELAVAGYKPDQIDVTLDQNILTIAGNAEKRQFSRSLVLPDEINPESIQAKAENGMLTIDLSFHPKAQPKKIAVQFESRDVSN